MTTSMVTETVLQSKNGLGYVTYIDEFPGSKKLTRVIQYLLLCKEGCVKSINIKYKENKI
jgi:hypothetical protein